MLSKLLLSLSLSVAPIVSVLAQTEYTDFDTFQTVDKYLADFDYLLEYEFRDGELLGEVFDFDYPSELFYYYVFPIDYYIEVSVVNLVLEPFYSNDFYKFYNVSLCYFSERNVKVEFFNYIGDEEEMSILALNSLSMSQVIDNDYTHGYYDDPTIYGSFYKFFTGFFPEYVVVEYHGIFTFVIVSFLLFLVFGFVFFLFRVIRRLVGFK